MRQLSQLRQNGFTLVEILVSMVIFAMLMMLVSNAMSFSFGFWSRNHSQLDDKIGHFITFEKLSHSIKATQPYGVKNQNRELETYFDGREESVSFVSDIGLYKSGPSLIFIKLTSDRNRGQQIVVAEKPLSEMLFTDLKQLGEIDLEWMVLFEQVRSMKLDYFGYRDLTSLNEDALNSNPFTEVYRNRQWFDVFQGSQTLILPEVIRLRFEQFTKGQVIERTLSFRIQVNDVGRYLLLNLNSENV